MSLSGNPQTSPGGKLEIGASPALLTEFARRAGRVAVLMGGESAEREVSLRSGGAVLAALKAQGIDAHGVDWQASRLSELLLDRPDRVFIALHGPGGEDGVLQGALQLAGIPYTGSGVLGCALSMDKIRAKQIWRAAGLPTPDFVIVDERLDSAAVIARLGLPLMVKPAREGSSIGISLVTRAEDLPAAVALAREFDDDVLLESYIRGGEYTVALVDDEVLPTIKLETPRAFYDYEAKYHADTTRYLCPAGLSAA
ncbi:MAG: D-alanine--D-alanine ligase, partial [Gammaproteobacteria bacterium]|nr:D-alanine--D-alanine ligase [Gammaproteobacteria bacterium]